MESITPLVKALKVLARGNQSIYHVSMDNLHSDLLTLAEAQELAQELAMKYQTRTSVHLGDTHIGNAFGDGTYVESDDHLDTLE